MKGRSVNMRTVDRLAAHAAMTANFIAQGIAPDEASRCALTAVKTMTPAKLRKVTGQ